MGFRADYYSRAGLSRFSGLPVGQYAGARGYKPDAGHSGYIPGPGIRDGYDRRESERYLSDASGGDSGRLAYNYE